MTDLEMWSFVVGSVSPVVLAILQQPKWSSQLRAVVAFLFCTFVAVVTILVNDVPMKFSNSREIVTSILIVFVTAISTYKGFWKPTGIAPSIERSTSPRTGV